MKRLYRSRNDSIIGGVCGGIARHVGADASIIRLAWVLFSLMGGAGVLLYFLAWIIIPEEPGTSTEPQSVQRTPSEQQPESVEAKVHDPEKNRRTMRITGFILIGLGGYFLLARLIPVRFSIWPLLLIAAGLVILLSGEPNGGSGNTQAPVQSEEPECSTPAKDLSDDGDDSGPTEVDEESEKSEG